MFRVTLAKIGHIKKYCFKWKKENKVSNYMKDKKNINDNIDSINVASSNDLLVVCNNNDVNISSHETTWVLDSGASHHVTFRRDFFSSNVKHLDCTTTSHEEEHINNDLVGLKYV